MSDNINIQNDGQAIAASDYWQSAWNAQGVLAVSPNAGCIRLLLPTGAKKELKAMKKAKAVVISIGHSREYAREMSELLFDDQSMSPYGIFVSPEQWTHMPGKDDFDKKFDFAVWTEEDGRPRKVLGKTCYLRAAEVPNLQPWG